MPSLAPLEALGAGEVPNLVRRTSDGRREGIMAGSIGRAAAAYNDRPLPTSSFGNDALGSSAVNAIPLSPTNPAALHLHPASLATSQHSYGSAPRSHWPSTQPYSAASGNAAYATSQTAPTPVARKRSSTSAYHPVLQSYGVSWTTMDDALLLNLVDRHGTKWQKVVQDFNSLRNASRSSKAVESRWRSLTIGSKGKPPLMPSHASSSSTKTSSSKLLPPSTSSKARSRKQPQPHRGSAWTQGETDVLRNSMARHAGNEHATREIYNDFYHAFPSSSRTHSAIRNRCHQLKGGRRDDDYYDDDEEDEDEREVDQDDSADWTERGEGVSTRGNQKTAAARTVEGQPLRYAQQHGQGRTKTQAHAHPRGLATSSKYLLDSETPERVAAYPTLGIPTPSPRQRHPELAQQQQRGHQYDHPHDHHPSSTASQPDQQDVNVSIEYAPTGLVISSLPRRHEVEIWGPTHIKLVHPRPKASSSFGEAAAGPRPAFHLRMLDDASVEPLRLPEGTTMNVGVVQAGNGEGVVVETRFRGPDGYQVVLRSAMGA